MKQKSSCPYHIYLRDTCLLLDARVLRYWLVMMRVPRLWMMKGSIPIWNGQCGRVPQPSTSTAGGNPRHDVL